MYREVSVGVLVSQGRRMLRTLFLIFLRRSWKLYHGWGVGLGGQRGDCSLLCCNNGDAEILKLALYSGWSKEDYDCSDPMKNIYNSSKWEFQNGALILPL